MKWNNQFQVTVHTDRRLIEDSNFRRRLDPEALRAPGQSWHWNHTSNRLQCQVEFFPRSLTRCHCRQVTQNARAQSERKVLGFDILQSEPTLGEEEQVTHNGGDCFVTGLAEFGRLR